jgi:hypothetical protein
LVDSFSFLILVDFALLLAIAFIHMVLVVVKGTTYKDEFCVEIPMEANVGEVTKDLTDIQNYRHRVQLQMYSARELLESAGKVSTELQVEFKALQDEISTNLKAINVPVTPDQYKIYWHRLKEMTCKLFPNECVHKDGEQAAVDNLYAMYDNPDIDEDYRLFIYHCRAMVDPAYRQHEVMDNNNKSKVTLKLAKSGGKAPSREPRLDYDSQREMRKVWDERAVAAKSLEASELHEKVKQMSRPGVILSAGAISEGDMKLNTSKLRPIFSGAEVKDVE